MTNIVKKCAAILIGFALTATGLWAAGAEEESAAAADKKYVTDPTTGKVVVAPEYGGTLTFANALEIANADAGLHGAVGIYVSGVIETLGIMNWAIDRDAFAFSSTYTPEFPFTGQLAESWDISPDGLTYTFHIRRGVHWHNKAPMNGRELTAEDIEYSFHRMAGLGDFSEVGGNYTIMKGLPWESITATDKYTVVMKLKEQPPVNTLSAILGKQTWIYPPEVIKEHGDAKDWRNLVGTGPYEMTDWVEGSSLTFTKNPNYWGHDEKYPENRLPYFDELQHLIITEEATRLAGLRSGQIDFLGFPAGISDIASVDVLESLRKTNPEIVLIPWWDRSETDEATAGTKRVDTFAERTWEGMIATVLGHNCPPPAFWCSAAHAHSKSIFNYHGIGYPELDALIDAAQATTSIEEQQKLIREVDMYTIENHYNVWGPKAGKFMAHQPWVIGYNGETLLSEQNRALIFARLWIDSELKKEMGR